MSFGVNGNKVQRNYQRDLDENVLTKFTLISGISRVNSNTGKKLNDEYIELRKIAFELPLNLHDIVKIGKVTLISQIKIVATNTNKERILNFKLIAAGLEF